MPDLTTAILLIGHGSRVARANRSLEEMAELVRRQNRATLVNVCFRELAKPDIQAGIDACVAAGAQRILLCPYFLTTGAHVLKDLPAELNQGRARHPGIGMELSAPLGLHPKLAEVVLERCRAAAEQVGWSFKGETEMPQDGIERNPLAIEQQSFATIDTEVGPHRFDERQWPVVRRIIHTTADFDFSHNTCFSAGVMDAALAALRGGAGILSDTNMVRAGVNKSRLATFGCDLACHVADADVAAAAQAAGVTRSIMALRKGGAEGRKIFLIGNAPTALFELLRLAEAGEVEPALVVGVPVGFVGAEESKEALYASKLPFILCRGRKGGSAIAAAILNQLLILAGEA